ncbi:MAG: VOC family protein [Nodosilinea sp.]
MQISHFDHLVLTVADLDRTCRFYRQVLGMEEITFGPGRRALRYGPHKINLHQVGAEVRPHAQTPTPGSGDMCFLLATALDAAMAHLQALNVPVLDGPVLRTGATGPIRSLYIRDPDGNLIELSVPAAPVD